MKNAMFKFLALMALYLMMTACKTASYEDSMQTLLVTEVGNSLQDYDSIVIIPRLGCNSCTHEADKYYQKFKTNRNLLFIFTNLQNLKLLKIENGYDLVKRENVMVDSENRYFLKGFEESDYPGILYWNDDGKLIHEYLLESGRMAAISNGNL